MTHDGSASTDTVYVIGSPSSHRVKIGRSEEVSRRLSEIQRMSPVILEVLWQTPGDHRLETALHRRFKDRREHGEWFDFGDEDPVGHVEAAVEDIRSRERSIRSWQHVEDFDGNLVDGALRFARSQGFLQTGLNNSISTKLLGSEVDRCAEILFVAIHHLAETLGHVAYVARNDPRSQRLEAASHAAYELRDALKEVPRDGYDWAGLPVFWVDSLSPEQFERYKQDRLEEVGLTFEELEQQARTRNFTSGTERWLWTEIGDRYA